MGFSQCVADPCLFVRIGGNGPAFVILYVDDLLVGCSGEPEAEEIRSKLAEHFTVKALGDARYILSMEVLYSRGEGEILVRQSQFISRLIERFDQMTAHAVRNPVVVGQDLRVDDGSKVLTERKPNRELIGSLMYLANGTRPDISVAVSTLSRHLERPQDVHWRVAIRIVRCLMGTIDMAVCYKRPVDDRQEVVAYCDANWGGDAKTRRSTSGVLVKMAGGPVIFKSNKQASVALSSAEAEYMALSLAVQEVLWLWHLLLEMGSPAADTVVIGIDNMAAISMALKQGYTPRAKHIDLHYHFVREHIQDGRVMLRHVPSDRQLADFLTKAISTPQFALLVSLSGVVISRAQVEGEC